MAAKSVNKVILLGNVGKDPETKYTAQGTPVCKFSLATNERFKDKNGEWQDRTEWHNLVLWEKLAEIAEQYVKKGGKIYIEGKLKTDSWEDKSGEKKYRTNVVVEDLVLLGTRDGGRSNGGSQGSYEQEGDFDQRPAQQRTGSRPATESDPITDEDIPF